MNEPQLYGLQKWEREMLAMQPTEAQQTIVCTSPLASAMPPEELKGKPALFFRKKRRVARIVAVILILITAIVIYFTWSGLQQDTSTSVQTVTTRNFSTATISDKTTATTIADSGDSIQVYIVGAVKRPGIYTLAANARVYQVLKDAGGPLPGANLVTINLAAPLKDGEEIYIPKIGEQMPASIGGSTGTSGNASNSASTGPLVNINTASENALRQQLHVSARTAQAIISYRLQHGSYTSVDQLANAVSKAIYDRIKGMVTV